MQVTRAAVSAWLCLLLVTLGGCGDVADEPAAGASGSAPSRTASSPTASAVPAPARGTAIVARNSEFGDVLFDDTGQAVYLFDIETTSQPRCYGACASAWPPVLTKGPPQARGQVRAGLLGTAERRDGDLQVTYRGHPLYYYAHEGKGEVECHDIVLNGGTWYAVQPDGRRAP